MLRVSVSHDPEADTGQDWVVETDNDGVLAETRYPTITAALAWAQDKFSLDPTIDAELYALAQASFFVANVAAIDAAKSVYFVAEGLDSAPLRVVSAGTSGKFPNLSRRTRPRQFIWNETVDQLALNMIIDNNSVIISSVL
jgi:hypothetical protein